MFFFSPSKPNNDIPQLISVKMMPWQGLVDYIPSLGFTPKTEKYPKAKGSFKKIFCNG